MELRKNSELPEKFFGLLFWNMLFAYLVIFLITGLLSLFGIKPVEFNDQDTYGFLGFVISMGMAPIMAFVTAFATWLFMIVGNFFLKLFVKFRRVGQSQ